jgi:hypothetical protein
LLFVKSDLKFIKKTRFSVKRKVRLIYTQKNRPGSQKERTELKGEMKNQYRLINVINTIDKSHGNHFNFHHHGHTKYRKSLKKSKINIDAVGRYYKEIFFIYAFINCQKLGNNQKKIKAAFLG